MLDQLNSESSLGYLAFSSDNASNLILPSCLKALVSCPNPAPSSRGVLSLDFGFQHLVWVRLRQLSCSIKAPRAWLLGVQATTLFVLVLM